MKPFRAFNDNWDGISRNHLSKAVNEDSHFDPLRSWKLNQDLANSDPQKKEAPVKRRNPEDMVPSFLKEAGMIRGSTSLIFNPFNLAIKELHILLIHGNGADMWYGFNSLGIDPKKAVLIRADHHTKTDKWIKTTRNIVPVEKARREWEALSKKAVFVKTVPIG
jgi:hypothetical protein